MNLRAIFHQLKIDIPLFISLMILAIFGLIILYSAAPSHILVVKQIIHLFLAIGVMIAIAQIPPYHIKRWTPYLLIIGIILLLLVLFFGTKINGAQRWLDLGFFRFQPSELLKIVVPIAIASILSESTLPPKPNKILLSFIAIMTVAFLIFKQPDLGTALLISSSGIFVLFFSGLSWKIIFGSLGIIIAILPIMWNFVLHSYQKQRVLTFLNPESDPYNTGYHIIQSKIAIGSGGISGKGYMQGSQSQLNFLPEHSTDFIFSVLSEEFGLIGVLVLLTIYAIIIYRCFVIAINTPDNFSRLLTAGLTMTFFTYIFVNIGMVSGLLPVVGMPLPFMSYGGTSLITLMISFGVIMSISQNKKYNG
ncbi:Rod shape-determining protein RodA [hydrothermal vent metagenome]|uniref:Rod shape-determining protein RodA n=1 Tax=hydrothermal vent metagenome TaxID=652676 RepID=A0A1W1CDN1_9ZZZZ